MDEELLTWLGNLLNFLILIYLTLNTIVTNNLNITQTLIASFGLLVSILIHLRNITKK